MSCPGGQVEVSEVRVVAVVHLVMIRSLGIVAPELQILLYLFRREDGEHVQVGLKMGDAEVPPEDGDPATQFGQRLRVQVLVSEPTLQLGLCVQDLLTKLPGPGIHLIEEALRLLKLLGGEVQLGGQLQDVEGARHSIQLCCQGHSEAGSFQQPFHFGLRESPDLPILEGGVWIVLLAMHGRGQEEAEKEEGGGGERQVMSHRRNWTGDAGLSPVIRHSTSGLFQKGLHGML